jgi:hypothetical protein
VLAAPKPPPDDSRERFWRSVYASQEFFEKQEDDMSQRPWDYPTARLPSLALAWPNARRCPCCRPPAGLDAADLGHALDRVLAAHLCAALRRETPPVVPGLCSHALPARLQVAPRLPRPPAPPTGPRGQTPAVRVARARQAQPRRLQVAAAARQDPGGVFRPALGRAQARAAGAAGHPRGPGQDRGRARSGLGLCHGSRRGRRGSCRLRDGAAGGLERQVWARRRRGGGAALAGARQDLSRPLGARPDGLFHASCPCVCAPASPAAAV